MSQVIFVGSKSSGLNALVVLHQVLRGRLDKVITFDDRLDSRSVFQEINDYCLANDLLLEVIVPSDLIDFLPHTRAKIFVVGWYTLLKDVLLNAHDFFGVHYSPLPRYRGNAPVVWQIINGEPDIGVTLFKFSGGMDDGDYVGQVMFPLLDSDHIGSVLAKADLAAADLLRVHAQAIVDGVVHLIPQDHSQATYCSLRVPVDGRIDWHWSAIKIVNFIRAQSAPYPGAFVSHESGGKVVIHHAVLDHRIIHAPIGAVFERRFDGVVIKCGDGAVKIVSAEMNGDRQLLKLFKSLKDRF